jgi:hypothetical protein
VNLGIHVLSPLQALRGAFLDSAARWKSVLEIQVEIKFKLQNLSLRQRASGISEVLNYDICQHGDL